MRLMMIGIAVAALLWSGYWLIGSRQAAADMAAWFDDRAAEGWTAEFGGLSTTGFPNRFDMTVSAPEIAMPEQTFGLSAPFVQVLRLSYKPEHAILIFPGAMTVSLAGDQIAVTSDRLRASAVLGTSGVPIVDRANLEAEGLALQSSSLGGAAIGKALAAIRRAAATLSGHDLALELRDVVITGASGTQALALDIVAFDASATLERPINLRGDAVGQIHINGFELRRFLISSEAFDVSASGSVVRDSGGRPVGVFDLQVRNWPRLLHAAEELGLLARTKRESLEAELISAPLRNGGAGPLDIRLEIKRGVVYLGSVESK